MTAQHNLTIDDLAETSGQPRRNIRFLISEGVVPEPVGERRWARYGPEHVHALAIYADMKSRGITSLDIIRAKISEPVNPDDDVHISYVQTSDGWELRLRHCDLAAEDIEELVAAWATEIKNRKKGK